MNSQTRYGLAALLALLGCLGAARAEDAPGSAAAIMAAVHQRDTGDHGFARLRMVIRGAGVERTRELVLRFVKLAGGTRRLMMFEAPAEVRSTGLLTNDYDHAEHQDEQWLYLPGLHQTTRVTTVRRSGSFVGSDFSYADLTRPDPQRYRHELVSASERVDGQECWLVRSTPLSTDTVLETGYSETETWVVKASHFPIRFKGTMPKGRSKFIAARGLRTIQGIVTPSQIVARVVHEGRLESETVIDQAEVRYGDPSIGEDEVSRARMERGL